MHIPTKRIPLAIAAAFTLALGTLPAAHAQTSDITITTPADGATVAPGPLQVSGVVGDAAGNGSAQVMYLVDVSGSTSSPSDMDCNGGRDLGSSLEETAARMGSQDFVWVTQAIAINREVGGNLAEVLDGVGQTIRERNQIRRQVKALAAEGKLSAYVLMALPFGIGGFLFMSNPDYILTLTESPIGWAMIVGGMIMLFIGGFWLSRVVNIKF